MYISAYESLFLSISAKLVDAALESGKIYEDEGFNYIKESFANNTLHLIGLMSDGGVHSRLDQVQVCRFDLCNYSTSIHLIFLDGDMCYYWIAVVAERSQ